MSRKLDTRGRNRRISSCCRHPSEPITGFCALCLRERLAGLDDSGDPEFAASESSFNSVGGVGGARGQRRAAASSSSLEGLRRCKSISVGKCDAFAGVSEPRRMSCDDRPLSTLVHLFEADDDKNCELNGESKVASRNIELSRLSGNVFESREEDENGGEIRVSVYGLGPNVNVDDEVEGEVKTMKEHIDLEWYNRKPKARDFRDIAGGILTAASIFSKKLQRLRKLGSGNGVDSGGSYDGSLRMVAETMNGEQLRESQSEVGDYGFGRRSCDSEPSFSVDAGRTSVDDSRLSFDKPRASWDGYLMAKTIPRLTPMLTVVEQQAMSAPVYRTDTHHSISVDGQMHSIVEDETTSGGSAHDYSDSSSSQRRSSFDCSTSIKSSRKKPSALDLDEMESTSNSNPSKVDAFHGTKLVSTDTDSKGWHLNFHREIHSEKIRSLSNEARAFANGIDRHGFKKSSKWRKACNLWGLRRKITDKKHEDHTGKTIESSFAECRGKQSREADGVLRGASKEKLVRSSSCAGSRHSFEWIVARHNPRRVGS